jgi:hypothetical protein
MVLLPITHISLVMAKNQRNFDTLDLKGLQTIGCEPAPRDPDAETLRTVRRRDSILALLGLCAGALACASGGLGKICSESGALGDWLRCHGANLFSDVTALRRLGAMYLVAHPEERSRQLLSRLLIDSGDGAIQLRLLRAIARDWSDHHVAVVDGWLLARTEARLCAFLHLEEGLRA